MRFSDCDFALPQARIASRPREPRTSAHLLNCLAGESGGGESSGGGSSGVAGLERECATFPNLRVSDLPALLRAGDIIVLNDTKVLPVRLRALYRAGGSDSDGHSKESATHNVTLAATHKVTLAATHKVTLAVTLVERIDDLRWYALVRGARRFKCGARFEFIDSVGRVVFCAEIEARDASGASAVSGMLILRMPDNLAGERLYDMLEGKVRPASQKSNQKGGEEGDQKGDEEAVRKNIQEINTQEIATQEIATQEINTIGSMPLPPYLKRAADERDLRDYQTLFARKRGAVAAPTAGRHITPSLLATLRAMGVASAFVTLHVGIGSFKPLRVRDIEAHRMASERVEISADTFAQIVQCRARGGRVLAVGTTVVRALESAALHHGYHHGYSGCSGDLGSVHSGYSGQANLSYSDYSGSTSLYITPGFRFRVVDLLLTNFHQARATPLILTCAFAGVACVAAAYRQARADARYRFFSYGDACLFTRAWQNE